MMQRIFGKHLHSAQKTQSDFEYSLNEEKKINHNTVLPIHEGLKHPDLTNLIFIYFLQKMTFLNKRSKMETSERQLILARHISMKSQFSRYAK
jgi:hypothetical protein